MVVMSTSAVGGRTYGMRKTSSVGWPRPAVRVDLPRSSNWAAAWRQPEVLSS